MIRVNFFVSSVLFFGILLGISDAYGSECGVLRFQQSRNPGVDISDNSCNDPEALGVGTVLQLSANSRVWLDPIAIAENASKYKIICLNESALSIKIRLANAFMPWIQPQGLIQCNEWVNRRLECNESGSDRTALICDIAKKVDPNHEIQRMASVIIRGMQEKLINQKLPNKQAGHLQLLFEKDINPKFELCESLFDREVAIAWTIDPKGQVGNVSITTNNSEDQFARCVVKVIKSYPFSPISSDVQIYSTFR